MRSTRWLAALIPACSGADSAEPARDVASVQVIDDGVPVAGVPVVFHDSDGRVAGVVRADATGFAEHPIEPGGLVTVAYPDAITLAVSQLQLLTQAGVAPGDHLSIEIPGFSSPRPADPGPMVGQVEIELPPLDGAGFFAVHLGCVGYHVDQLTAILDVPRSCLGQDDRIDITVDAMTPPDLPSRIATTYARQIEIRSGEISRVRLPDWVSPQPSLEVTLTGIPAAASSAVAIPVMLADGLAFPPVLADSAALSGDAANLSPGFYPGFAEAVDLEVRVQLAPGDASAVHLLSAPVVPVIEIAGSTLLPAVRAIALDPSAGQLSWTATGGTGGADATFLRLSSERREGVVTRRRRWTIVAPPDTASPFALPELPAELDPWRPRATDEHLVPGLVILDVDWIDGFEAFAADHGLGFLDEPCVPAGSTARVARSGVFSGPVLQTASY